MYINDSTNASFFKNYCVHVNFARVKGCIFNILALRYKKKQPSTKKQNLDYDAIKVQILLNQVTIHSR